MSTVAYEHWSSSSAHTLNEQDSARLEHQTDNHMQKQLDSVLGKIAEYNKLLTATGFKIRARAMLHYV